MVYTERSRGTVLGVFLQRLITLPKKGKYTISFFSKDFDAFIRYPEKITAEDNGISIRLALKSQVGNNFKENNNYRFIGFGNIDANLKKYSTFREKYEVVFEKAMCLDEVYLKEGIEANNKRTAAFLDEKFGRAWRTELPENIPGL